MRYGSKAFQKYKLGLRIVAALACAAVVGLIGLYVVAPVTFKRIVYQDFLFGKLVSPFVRIFESHVPRPGEDGLPFYSVTINEESLDKMYAEQGGKEKNWYSAFLSYEREENVPVRLKLKGHHSTHWAGPKKSIWIKTKAGSFVNDWKRSAIVNFRGPHFIIESLAFDMADKVGVISPRVRPINLFINNKYAGFFYEMEDIDRYYLRNIERTMGDIYALDEYENPDGAFFRLGSWRKKSFNNKKPKDDRANLALLHDCLKGKCPVESVLRVDHFLRNHIIYELIGSDHLDSWHNVRIYFDPSAGRFEPMTWDISYSKADLEYDQSFDFIAQSLLKQPKYRKRKLELQKEILESKFTEEYLKKFFTDFVANVEKSMRSDLHFGHQRAYSFFEWKLKQNDILQVVLKRRNEMVRRTALASSDFKLLRSGDDYWIEYAGAHPLVIDGQYVAAPWRPTEAKDTVLEGKQVLAARLDKNPLVVPVEVDQKIVSAIGGTPIEVFDLTSIDVDTKVLTKKDDWKPEDTAIKEIVFSEGLHRMKGVTIYPKNTLIRIEAGARLQFEKDASLVTYGRVDAAGTAEKPIKISGVGDQPWGVFSVHGEGGHGSRFEYVHFRRGKDATIDGVFYSGMFNCYHANCDVHFCHFSDNYGDDALNFKSSTSEIFHSIFLRTGFDAADLDFTSGDVYNNLFLLSGNDSVDLGTGHATVFDNVIWRSGDKGISAGERSYPLIFHNFIIENELGIASKDQSFPVMAYNYFEGNGIDLTGYQKKASFGGTSGLLIGSLFRLKPNGKISIEHDPQSKFIQRTVASSEAPTFPFHPERTFAGCEDTGIPCRYSLVRRAMRGLKQVGFHIDYPTRWGEFLELRKELTEK